MGAGVPRTEVRGTDLIDAVRQVAARKLGDRVEQIEQLQEQLCSTPARRAASRAGTICVRGRLSCVGRTTRTARAPRNVASQVAGSCQSKRTLSTSTGLGPTGTGDRTAARTPTPAPTSRLATTLATLPVAPVTTTGAVPGPGPAGGAAVTGARPR